MGDHIGLRKLASLAADLAGAKAPFEVLKETCVEIDLLIDRTIERPLGAVFYRFAVAADLELSSAPLGHH